MGNDMVADYELGAAAEFIELLERIGGRCCVPDPQRRISPDRADIPNPLVGTYLEIQYKTVFKETG